MNALVEECDEALKVLFSGKSPLAFGGLTAWSGVLGIPFLFGDPAERKILAGDTRQYSGALFQTIAGGITIVGPDVDGTLDCEDAVESRYEDVAELFGYGAGFKSDCDERDVWVFDWSLAVKLAEDALLGADFGFLRLYDETKNAAVVRPMEQLHDRAVAEIIFEGYDDTTFVWDPSWGKFGCLRFHNLDRQTLTIDFGALGTVEIPPLGCQAVRQYGASGAQRTGIDTSRQYLWAFRHGDAPVWEATRDQTRGVWGSQGYSSLASLSILRDWITAAGLRMHRDPRVRWDGTSAYAASFALSSDSDCLAKYALHPGTFRSLKLEDEVWSVEVGTFSWSGNTLLCDLLDVTIDGAALQTISTHTDLHDVIPLTTNMLPVGAQDALSSMEVEVSSPIISFSRLDPDTAEVTRRYYDRVGAVPDIDDPPIDLSMDLDVGTSVLREADIESPFVRTVADAKAMAFDGDTEPDSDLSTFTARTTVFDGLTLLMGWSFGYPLGVPFDTRSSGPIPSNMAEWDLDEEGWEFVGTSPLVNASEGYALMPGRLDRYVGVGDTGFLVGSDWTITQHPDVSRGTLADGQDWRWDAPASVKPGIRYHGQAPGQATTRTWPVIQALTNWIQAVEESEDPDWWESKRDGILAGDLSADDRQRIWRMPGAREHYNHVAAVLNSIQVIDPFQFTDLTYYGDDFPARGDTGGAPVPPRFGAYLVAGSDRRARAVEYGMDILDATDIPVFAELEAQPLGAGTWLSEALPLVGFAASDTPPDIEWVTIDEIARIAETFGVPYTVERVSVPKRLAVYRTEERDPGDDTLWFGVFDTAAYFETNGVSDYDFLETLDSRTAAAITTWFAAIDFPDTPADNVAYVLAQFPQGVGDNPDIQPFGATQHMAVMIERVSYMPEISDLWTMESRSRVLIQPQPHFRFSEILDREDPFADSGFAYRYIQIAEVAAPDADAAALTLDTLMTAATSMMLTPTEIKAAIDPGGASWGDQAMTFVTLIDRVGAFRV